MGGKSKAKKSGKDPFANLFPKSKPIGSLFPKMKKQKSIIPNIKMPQQQFLKRTSGMKQRFTDHDRDGVVSGLDCFPFDKKRHGIVSKAKNWIKGEGFRENEEIEQAVENERENLEMTRKENERASMGAAKRKELEDNE